MLGRRIFKLLYKDQKIPNLPVKILWFSVTGRILYEIVLKIVSTCVAIAIWKKKIAVSSEFTFLLISKAECKLVVLRTVIFLKTKPKKPTAQSPRFRRAGCAASGVERQREVGRWEGFL